MNDPSRLYQHLLNTGLQNKDNPLYQLLRELITAISQLNSSPTRPVTGISGLPTGVQGDILYHNGTGWAKLPIDIAGEVLTSDGIVPVWNPLPVTPSAEARAYIYRATNQVIVVNTPTVVTFSDEVFDVTDIWDVAQPTKLVIPINGTYLLNCNAVWESNIDGLLEAGLTNIIIKKNTVEIARQTIAAGVNIDPFSLAGQLVIILELAENDELEMWLEFKNDSTEDITVLGGSDKVFFQLNLLRAGVSSTVTTFEGVPPSSAYVYRSSDIVINDETPTAIPFTHTLFDINGLWDVVLPTRITINDTGMYIVNCGATWTEEEVGLAYITIRKNGVEVSRVLTTGGIDTASPYQGNAQSTILLNLGENDYIEMWVDWRHNVPTTPATIKGGAIKTFLQISSIGFVGSATGSGSTGLIDAAQVVSGVLDELRLPSHLTNINLNAQFANKLRHPNTRNVGWFNIAAGNLAPASIGLGTITSTSTLSDHGTQENAVRLTTTATATTISIRTSTAIDTFRVRNNPYVRFVIYTGASIANLRLNIGFSSGQPTTDLSINRILLRYSTSIPDPGWVGVISPALIANAVITAKLADIAVDTRYVLEVEILDDQDIVRFGIDGVYTDIDVSAFANRPLPLSNLPIGWYINGQTLIAETKYIAVAKGYLEWD